MIQTVFENTVIKGKYTMKIHPTYYRSDDMEITERKKKQDQLFDNEKHYSFCNALNQFLCIQKKQLER